MEDQVHFLERWEWRKWAKIPSSNHLEALGINTLVLGVLVLNGNGQYQFFYNKQIDCIWQNLTGQLKKEEWEIRKRKESREKVENKRRKREKKHATHKGARTMKWKGSGVWGLEDACRWPAYNSEWRDRARTEDNKTEVLGSLQTRFCISCFFLC